MREIIALAVGYLLGSFLPAYFLGRLRGIDIRDFGTHNAGTTNAYHILGLWPAVLTAAYDVLKGLAAMLIAWGLGVPEPFILASGVMAVVGHRFPFYLRFRGAEGVGTSTGMLLASLGYAFYKGWWNLGDLILLALLASGLWLIFRRGGVVGVFVLPIVYATIAYRSTSLAFTIFLGIVTGYIFVVNVLHVYRERLLALTPETRARFRDLRVLMRPAAIAFPILYLFVSKTVLLILVGSVTLFFITVDIVRLASGRLNVALLSKVPFFFRKKEEQTFTSATLFLLGVFLTIFLFPKPQATTAIVFVTLGDVFAKFTGTQYGKRQVFSRTLEGSLAYFASCAIAAFVWSRFVPIAPVVYLLGAFAAAVTEAVPTGLDDNFTVPIISGAVMTLAVALPFLTF